MASGIVAAQRALVVVALVGSLAACATGPRPAADCGRHFTGGSGLLGLMGAMGAFDRPAGPECRQPVFAGTPGFVPSAAVVEPTPAPLPQTPELPPLPEVRPRLLVPAGGGTLMELGGGAPPRLMVPAGGGALMTLP